MNLNKRTGEVAAYSRTALAESVVLNFAKVLTYSSVLLYTLSNSKLDHSFCWREIETYAVSGASLSRFSSKYLTSEINRQPALLNSFDRSFSTITWKSRTHLGPISKQQHPPPRSVVFGEVGTSFFVVVDL